MEKKQAEMMANLKRMQEEALAEAEKFEKEKKESEELELMQLQDAENAVKELERQNQMRLRYQKMRKINFNWN